LSLAALIALAALVFLRAPMIHVAPASLYLLASVLPGVPLGPVNAALGQPSVQSITFAGAEGTIAADLYVPPGSGPHPAILIVNGALAEGRKYPALAQFATALARSGYTALVPDYPDLLHEELTPASREDVELTLRRLSALPSVQPGHVELVGFCVGGTLGLLAAEDPQTPPLRAVVDLAGYVSSTDMIQLITTNTYEAGGKLLAYAADPWVVAAVARSLVAGLPVANDRAVFAPLLGDPPPDHYVAPNWSTLPPARLSGGGQALLALLLNRDPAMVPALIAALPSPMPEQLSALSPETRLDHLRFPVYVVADRSDTYVPNAQSVKLEERQPSLVHLSYVSLLAHVEPELPTKSNVLATIKDVAGGAWQLFAAMDHVLAALQ